MDKTILIAALVYSLVISILFFLPTTELPQVGFSAADKMVHVIVYFLLVNLWLAYLYVKNGFQIGARFMAILFFSILLYGIIVEIFQGLFTESREADIYDLFANVLGTLLGIFFFKKIKHYLNTEKFN